LILHYKASRRNDSPFWRHSRDMAIPEGLARRIALFQSHGRVAREHEEMFAEENWVQVLLGQGIVPARPHPLAGQRPDAELDAYLADTGAVVARCVAAMPSHAEFIARHCAMASSTAM
jgi:tryptophan halogenase